MTAWWRGAVFYQIYPRSFFDSNGDGIGDLNGITQRIDHVADLGVDAIWLSPFFKSPMKDFGYDVEDYRAVDPIFGTVQDFDRMLEAAHRRGLKLIIDLVISHSSDRHPWFVESRVSRTNDKADWYVWADAKPDGTPPNNWLSVFGGPAWQWDTRRRQYYLHNFLPSQPDLNLHNREVQDAVLAEAEFWLARGVDGFRLDATNFFLHDPLLRDNPPRPRDAADFDPSLSPDNPYSMQWHVYDKSRPENLDIIRRIRRLLDRYPGAMAVAEIGDDYGVERSAEYTAAPDLLHTAYSFSLLGRRFGARAIREAVEKLAAQPGDSWPSWAFSNHDVERVASRWGGSHAPPALAKLLVAVLCSLRGTIFIYQGEELGLPEAAVPFDRLRDPAGIAFWPEYKGRDGCRTPMPWTASDPLAGFSRVEPWLPIPDEHRRRAVDLQEADPDSVLNFTRRFLAWRKEFPALIQGDLAFLDTPEPILAFMRNWENETLVLVFNLGDTPVQVDAAHFGIRRLLTGHGLSGTLSDTTLDLPAYGGLAAFGHGTVVTEQRDGREEARWQT